MPKDTNCSQQVLYKLLEEGKVIWVLYLDIIKFQDVEFHYGYDVCQKILRDIEHEIRVTLKQQQSYYFYSLLENKGGDDFVVYFVPNENIPWAVTEVIEKWVDHLQECINKEIANYTTEKLAFRSGLVECKMEDNRSAEYLIYSAVKEAFLLNKSEPDPQYFPRKHEITQLIDNPEKNLHIAFQPIIETRSSEIFGFEALSRILGPTAFPNIADLFTFAEKIGQLYPVETLCRRRAIQSFPAIQQKKEMLFLNINPKVLIDPKFAAGHTRKLLSELGLTPNNVVLEITEHSAIENFKSFGLALAHYRDQGFLIALDDVGAGYSSLQSIAELHPDFLKIDRSLISNINSDPIKWALLETFVTFSKRIGCRIIAEGVETAEEMQTVVQLGVDFIQGYFVARPELIRPNIQLLALEILASKRKPRSRQDNAIISLVEHLPLFDHKSKVNTIESYFRKQPDRWFVGITEDERIVGVVQRDNLFAALGTRYGVSLYSERNISQIMDKSPLIVEDTTPVEVVSKIAMERQDAKLYDGIVVAKQRKPIGMVKVATLMKAMADFQIQIARGANPLTGLPGNEIIDQEIRNRLELNQGFGILYVDLNKFKNYNDLYGFRQGDMAILMLAQILISEAKKRESMTFVGHIGGDDFIVLTSIENLYNFTIDVLASFEQESSRLIGAEVLSVALAGLRIDSSQNLTTIDLAQQAARIKKNVKCMQGNAFILN